MTTIFTAPQFLWGAPDSAKSQQVSAHLLASGVYEDVPVSASRFQHISLDLSGSMESSMSRKFFEEIKTMMLDRRVGKYAIPFNRNPVKFTPKPYRLPSVKRRALLNSVAITG